ncbi:MAG: hypothetical protein RBS19_09475 [Bacteroidales bacterium]|nr:hypothetical protein [Bacteroidales bacterium]MDY0217173.1 hypothetical protein [Bacteroidales bacterium]
MKIILNNNLEIIQTTDEIICINDILAFKNFNQKRFIAIVNNKVVKHENFDIPMIREGDMVQIIHQMGIF